MPRSPREIVRELSEARIEQLFQSRLRREIRKAQVDVTDELALKEDIAHPVTVGVTFDGGPDAIAQGAQAELRIDRGFTITDWVMLADEVGSIQIDIWKDTYAGYPPTVADTITASAVPAITDDDQNTDSTLSGWTLTVSDGDILKFNVDSIQNIRRCTLFLMGINT